MLSSNVKGKYAFFGENFSSQNIHILRRITKIPARKDWQAGKTQ